MKKPTRGHPAETPNPFKNEVPSANPPEPLLDEFQTSIAKIMASAGLVVSRERELNEAIDRLALALFNATSRADAATQSVTRLIG